MKVNVVEKLSDTELKVQSQCRGDGGGWFQIFFIFTPNLGEMIQFDYIFFR